jgi:hypothetical protein
LQRKEKALAEAAALLILRKKSPDDLVRQRGRLINVPDRLLCVSLIREAAQSGCRLEKACDELGLSLRTFQRWVGDGDAVLADGRTTTSRPPPRNKLSEVERHQILEVANCAEFASLPPSQIVPSLADRGVYVASESSFYRVLRGASQHHHRRRARKPSTLAVTSHCATAANQLRSWDITWMLFHRDVQFGAVLVDRSPQQVRLASKRNEHLVEVPRATRPAARGFHPMSEALAKLVAPASDRLVSQDHPALEEQLFDITQAQLKAKIPTHGATNDWGRKTETVIQRFQFLHLVIRRDRPINLTMPFAANRVQHLQQQGPNQLLRSDARPATLGVALVHLRKHALHSHQRLVQPLPNRAQRVVRRHKIVQLAYCEHRFGIAIGTAHCSLHLFLGTFMQRLPPRGG